MSAYPFIPRSNARLKPGQFWAIPLSDGRFACGRVLRVDRELRQGRRTMFVAGLLDWVGSEPPTFDSIAGAPLLEAGRARVELISFRDGAILGERALHLDRIVPPATLTSYWGEAYAADRAESSFLSGDPPPRAERREVSSPLTEAMLQPSATGHGVVQFRRLLTDADFERLAGWLRAYPELTLRVYASNEVHDLEFLRFFPSIRRVSADGLWQLESLDGLRHLPTDLVQLGLGRTKRRLDLEVIGRFTNLRKLSLEAQTKNIEVVSRLTSLEDLRLRSITLRDLALLLPLRRLVSLELKLGGTNDLALLPRIGRLRYLELWRVRGLSDISMLGQLPHLRYLFLQALKHVESLPDLSAARALRRVHLETMRGIRDLAPLASAPSLEEILLIDMPQLRLDDLRPLVGLHRLTAATVGLGNLRKNAEARQVLGLPAVSGAYDWREDR